MRPLLPENDSNEPPRICEDCESFGDCDKEPAKCESDAIERAAEARWEADRDRGEDR